MVSNLNFLKSIRFKPGFCPPDTKKVLTNWQRKHPGHSHEQNVGVHQTDVLRMRKVRGLVDNLGRAVRRAVSRRVVGERCRLNRRVHAAAAHAVAHVHVHALVVAMCEDGRGDHQDECGHKKGLCGQRTRC